MSGKDQESAAPILGRGRGRGLYSLLTGRSSTPQAASRLVVEPEVVQTSQPVYSTKPDSAKESKVGTLGRSLQLSANYFRLVKKPEFEFRLYRVDFHPFIDDARMLKAFVGKQRDVFGGYLFDGMNMLYLTRRLPRDNMQFTCESREGQEYTMTVKSTGAKIAMTDAMATQILNIILRRTMDGLKMQQVGRNLYDPDNKVLLEKFKVELWPGYITSIRQHEHDVLVCCEVSHKIMRLETIYDVLRTCKREEGSNYQDSFRKAVIGATVLTDYNNKTYRVDDVDFTASPNSTFMMKDKEMSYVNYYQQRYQRQVKDASQPMLISNPKARDIRAGRNQVLFLVPELCRSTGLNEKMRSDFQMMKAMADHTQMAPEKRKARLLDFTRRLHNSEESKAKLRDFNVDIDDELVSFKGRALTQETMVFGGGKTASNDDNVDWTNPMKTSEMYQAVPLKRWVLLYPKKTARETEDFLALMTEVAQGMRFDMSAPKCIDMPDDRIGSYVKNLEDVIQKDPKLIMVVVPNNAADRYSAIKRLTSVTNAIPTQVIVLKTMMPKKGNMAGVKSIATKVVIQLNCKLGGAPWSIKFPMKGVMAVGFDVTHDTRDRSQSFGAFIASMDIKQTVKYYSAASAHKDGAEMSENIFTHMVQALHEFKEEHGTLPERIFFYRDGVGDGQIEYVHKTEVRGLEEKLRGVYSKFGQDGPPKFSFIIVNKRINTRIFVQGRREMENPKSGTIVDNTITLPERYDFYLVSQSVRQGTVAPTSYNVIHDSNGLTPDQLQMLTYKQTHLYYNWSGCTRVPAVVQYAHKLSVLVGEHLHQLPSKEFTKQLYFL